MTFKPGMHQNCEPKKVDFDAVVAKMAGAKPQATFPMFGWGKKVFIKATISRKAGDKTEIEFYVELTFPECPANREVGYTKEDAILFHGVQILEFEDAESKQNHGEILAYEDFVERHITDGATRITLDRVMEGMAGHLIVTDQTVERINDAWGNRDPGESELFSVQSH